MSHGNVSGLETKKGAHGHRWQNLAHGLKATLDVYYSKYYKKISTLLKIKKCYGTHAES